MKYLVLVAWIGVAACGPSAAEIRTAQTATYQTTAADMYNVALQTAAEDYKIGETDERQAVFATVPQWYSPEGGRQSAGAGDFVQIDDRSIELSLVVEVVELDDSRVTVKVTPVTMQHLSGSPKPRELAPDDPNLPGWVTGRAESLQLAIYNHAKQYTTK
jgi:hypothetical protein